MGNRGRIVRDEERRKACLPGGISKEKEKNNSQRTDLSPTRFDRNIGIAGSELLGD